MVPGRRYSIRYILRLVRRRWVMLLLPVLVIGGLALLLARTLPDVFYAQGTVVIVRQTIPESYVRTTVTVPIAERVQRTSQQLRSPAVLAPIIAEFNLYPNLRDTVLAEALNGWMARNIRIELVSPDTAIVGYSGFDQGVVRQVAARLVDLFIESIQKDRETLAQNTSQFLDVELERTRKRLQEQEARVQQFREQYAGELPGQAPANLQILQGVQTQLQSVVEDLRQDRARRAQLQEVIVNSRGGTDSPADAAPADAAPEPDPEATAAEPPKEPAPAIPTTATDPDPLAIPPGPAAQRLAVAKLMLAEMLKKYTPEYPDVVRMRQAIEQLEKAAAASPPVVASTGKPPALNPARLPIVEAEIARLDTRIAEREALERRLRDASGTYLSRIEAVPGRESDWVALTRDYQTIQQAYTSLLAKKEEATLAANLERQSIGEQARVSAAPVDPSRPISPNRPGVIMIGVLLGLGIGLAAVVTLEVTDSKIRSEQEVLTALRLPVLALFPQIVTTEGRKRMRRRRLMIGVSALVVVAVGALLRWR
jgi:polysaccharide chain length determinant protein (PEP-CTERM system associated)